MTRKITTAADLDAIEADIAACRTYNFGMYQADRLAHEHAPALVEEVERLRAEVARLREKIDVDRAMHEAFRPEVVAEVAVPVCDEMDWQAVADWCGGTIDSVQDPSGEYTSSIAIPGVGEAYQGMWIVQRHDLTFAIRATLEGPSAESVARLTARPAPAWNEVAVKGALIDAQLASVRRIMNDGYPSTFNRSNEDAADAALAVVRDHLPVKPSREDIYRAWHGTDDPWGGCADSASIERVLDLLPGRSEAKVKAEALREWIAEWPTTPDDGTFLADVARDGLARADVARLEEGLSDRTMDLAEVARLRTMVGDCHCDKNPETTNGPEEDCPQHGRPVAEVWGLVERAEAGWDHARAEVDRLRAEVRLAKASARPAPAWDEEAVYDEAQTAAARVVAPYTSGPMDPLDVQVTDAILAVVREHLPVKPSRGAVVRAMHAEVCCPCDPTGCDVAEVSENRYADAVLDLWPGRSEAEVKAEALNDAASMSHG